MSKMPKKLKDHRSFTLPIQIGKSDVVNAFSDLGVSINLMNLLIFNTLGLGKLRPSLVMLQMTNRTRVIPEGIIEDVLIKVGKFIIPADFIILDYDANYRVPIILDVYFWRLVEH